MCCRMWKKRVERASEHGLGSIPPSTELENSNSVGLSPKRSPIQNGRPSYIGACVRTKCTSQNSSRARNGVVAYKGCLTHKPITARYLVLPTRPHRDWRRDWVYDGGGPLGIGQWDIHIQISLRNDLRAAFACRHLRLKYVYRCQARVALSQKKE